MLQTSPRGTQNLFVRLLMVPIALLFVLPVKSAKWLNKKVYTGIFEGITHAFLAVAGGVYAALQTTAMLEKGGSLGANIPWLSNFVAHAHSGWVALPAGLLMFLLTAVYIFPAIWLIALRPAWRVSEWTRKHIRDFFRADGQILSQAIVGLARFMPGSKKIWTKVSDANNRSWFIGLQYAVAYPGIFLSCSYVGWRIFSAVQAHAGSSLIGIIVSLVGVFLAFMVGVNVWTALSEFLSKGKTATLSIYIGLASIWGAHGYVSGFAASIGLSGVLGWLAFPIAFVLFCGYIYPGVTLALSDGFIKRVYEALKPRFEKAYDDRDNGFLHLFHQVLNLAVSAAITYGAACLGQAVGLPLLAVCAFAAVTAYLSYNLVGEMFDWEGGNYILGLLLAVFIGFSTAVPYANHNLLYGVYGAIFVGVFSALVTFFAVYPGVYLLLKGLFSLPGLNVATNGLGNGLRIVHQYVWKNQFEKLVRKCETIYGYSYRDTNQEFRTLTGHVANLAFAAFIAWVSITASHFFGWGALGTYALTIAATALSYLLVGKLIFTGSVESVGTVVSLGAGILAGAHVLHAQPLGMLFALPFGVLIVFATYFLFFPIAYLVVRKLTSSWLTKPALAVLGGIYTFAWKRFQVVFDTFVSVYRAVAKFLGIILRPVGRFLASCWSTLMSVWDSLFGGRRRT